MVVLNNGDAVKNRLLHIDRAKGCGILLVVLGHAIHFTFGATTLFNVIFSFHIPLFFLISGALYSKKTISELFKKQGKALLVPYLSIAFLVGGIDVVQGDSSVQSALVGIFYASGASIPSTALPAWFLVNLFFVQLVYRMISVFGNTMRLVIVLLLFLVSYYLLGVVPVQPYPLWGGVTIEGLPFSLDIVGLSLFFFYIGQRFRLYVQREERRVSHITVLFFLFGALSLAGPFSMDLCGRSYDHLVLTTFTAVSGVFLMLECMRWIPEGTFFDRFFRFWGERSLMILLFHMIILFFLLKKILFLFPGHPAVAIGAAMVPALSIPVFLGVIASRSTVLALLWGVKRRS